jgi:aldose 1-epimerase
LAFQVTWSDRPNTVGLDTRVALLGDDQHRLEVWPAFGFNAFRWLASGQELLYRTPQFFDENRPSRGGFPILFPFPNRIRDGRFTWDGKSYQLPLNDPAGKNAIHGFACYRPWRIVDQGASTASAWITAEFHAARDAVDVLPLWAGDHRIRVTYRLLENVLRVEADVDNPGSTPLPFGLGYHPYFKLATFAGPKAIVRVASPRRWELLDNLPTGKLLDVDEKRDLRHGQFHAALQLDDVATDLYNFAYDPDEQLGLVAMLQNPPAERVLTMWVSEGFREMVLFTPPHREAICLEPYTCVTDAINLPSNSGLRVLPPGEHWRGVVELHAA